jgi:hypothetical protein
MGHVGPKLEAEKDETLGQNLRERGQKTSIFHFKKVVKKTNLINLKLQVIVLPPLAKWPYENGFRT